jgi:hypothetical protein
VKRKKEKEKRKKKEVMTTNEMVTRISSSIAKVSK